MELLLLNTATNRITQIYEYMWGYEWDRLDWFCSGFHFWFLISNVEFYRSNLDLGYH